MADDPVDKTIVVPRTPVPESAARPKSDAEDVDVTVRISESDRVSQTAVSSSDTHDVGYSTLAFSSTRLLNYLTGRKLRNVDDELDMLAARSKAPAEVVWDSEKVILKKLDGSYEIRETIGEGGQGIVSRAYDTALQRNIALKSLRKELTGNENARRSFIGEALMTASLDHPAIIPVYSLNTDDDGGLHLAMKVLNGKSLKEHLSGILSRYQRAGINHFDENESLNYRIDIFLRVCETMAYVHQKRIIHCDLKPENIMIGEYRETYIMDWGIAQKIDAPRDGDTRIMGTPRYTSPENLAGVKCDQRSDIYSLGVILFELVTLCPAFSGKSVQELVNRVRSGHSNPLRHKFGAPISADLAAIIRKAMALDPGSRYQKTEELIDDLRRWIRGAEVSANPDGFFGKILRWSNHHRRLVLGGAALIAVSSISLSVIGVYAKLAAKAETERRQEKVVNYAFSSMRRVAEGGALQLAGISDMLNLLSSNAALLKDLNGAFKLQDFPDFIDGFLVGKNKVARERLFASKLLGGEVLDINHVSASTPWRNDPARFREFCREKELMRPLIPALQQAVLQSVLGSFAENAAEQKEEYCQGDLPVVKSYCCLKSSSIFCYPALSHMEGGYNGCLRPWYLHAEQHRQGPVWGEPYQDSGDAGVLMMTCSMAVIGAKNEFYGVAAVDVPLSVFEKRLSRNPELSAYILRRQVVDASGSVVLEVRSIGRQLVAQKCCEKQNGQLEFSKFSNTSLLKLMRSRRYGSTITTQGRKKILWLFSTMRALNWLYVEMIDLDALMHFPPALR